MKTKLQLLFVAFFTIFSLSVMAQAKKNSSPEEIAKGLTDKMTKSLSLTKDQIPQVQTVNEDYVKKVHELKNMQGVDKSLMESKIKENNAYREVAIRRVITEKQYETYLRLVRNFQIK